MNRFRSLPKISEDFPKILKNYKIIEHLKNTSELFPKFSRSFTNCLSSSKRGLKRFWSFQKFAEICHLYFLRMHTCLKARVYTENTSDAWHIPRYPTRKHCITSIYPCHCTTFQANEILVVLLW